MQKGNCISFIQGRKRKRVKVMDNVEVAFSSCFSHNSLLRLIFCLCVEFSLFCLLLSYTFSKLSEVNEQSMYTPQENNPKHITYFYLRSMFVCFSWFCFEGNQGFVVN